MQAQGLDVGSSEISSKETSFFLSREVQALSHDTQRGMNILPTPAKSVGEEGGLAWLTEYLALSV